MAKYVLKYMFEWGGTCLWSVNDAAIEKYGYGVDERELPISGNLKRYLWYLQAYHDCFLDWEDPHENSPWMTDEDYKEFNRKAKFAYEQLCKELGEDYEIVSRDVT